jgi:DNA-binding transcriptional LysR family regulator
LGRVPMLAEHLRDGRLIAPFPKRYDSARGYFALTAPRAGERSDVRRFLRWLIDEAAHESLDVQPNKTSRNQGRPQPLTKHRRR